jgi:REase_DpnII-MboI
LEQVSKSISELRKQLSELTNEQGKKLQSIQDQLNEHSQYVVDLSQNWAGGWGRADYNEYYSFERGTQVYEMTPAYFNELLIKKKGVDLSKFTTEVFNLLAPYKKFQIHLVTELSIIRDVEAFSADMELLDKLEKYDWGFDVASMVKYMRPNNIPVYDMSILSKGLPTPPHVLFHAEWLSTTSKAHAAKDFNDTVIRLLRQIELRLGRSGQVDKNPLNERIISDIFENFHTFSRQLRNRHNDRTTIDIEDEYDVQDLLHAILSLHFNDVRAEEYTPSYAGSSTRMDFLIKEEEIIIEVKKTRKNLDDKEVGNQLILDVAHYANHPNCKRLICFVYDPEGRIRNPRGLENDISKLTTDTLKVELLIRP